jgi:hypothetical protein
MRIAGLDHPEQSHVRILKTGPDSFEDVVIPACTETFATDTFVVDSSISLREVQCHAAGIDVPSTRLPQFKAAVQLTMPRCRIRMLPLMRIDSRDGLCERSDGTLPDQLPCGFASRGVTRRCPTPQHCSPVAQRSARTCCERVS